MGARLSRARTRARKGRTPDRREGQVVRTCGPYARDRGHGPVQPWPQPSKTGRSPRAVGRSPPEGAGSVAAATQRSLVAAALGRAGEAALAGRLALPIESGAWPDGRRKVRFERKRQLGLRRAEAMVRSRLFFIPSGFSPIRARLGTYLGRGRETEKQRTSAPVDRKRRSGRFLRSEPSSSPRQTRASGPRVWRR